MLDRRLIVVTGKGGVGKSTLTAAFARMVARRGRRTVALQVDPRENLFRLLGSSPSGGELVEAGHNLFVQNLKPNTVCDWIVEQQLRIGPLVRRVKKSLVYQRFVETAPGLTEIATLGHALRLLGRRKGGRSSVDTVVLDAPASGHGVSLLRAPGLLADVIKDGPVGGLAAEVAELVADTENTAVAVVTIAEEMPVQEALELRAELQNSCSRAPELLIVNCLYPPDAGEIEMSGWRESWCRRAEVNRRELERLERMWQGSKLLVPLLPIDDEVRLTDAVTSYLAEGLDDG